MKKTTLALLGALSALALAGAANAQSTRNPGLLDAGVYHGGGHMVDAGWRHHHRWHHWRHWRHHHHRF